MQMIFKADTGQKNQQILSGYTNNQEDPKQVTSQKQGESSLRKENHSAHVRKPSETRKSRKELTSVQLANCLLGKVQCSLKKQVLKHWNIKFTAICHLMETTWEDLEIEN